MSSWAAGAVGAASDSFDKRAGSGFGVWRDLSTYETELTAPTVSLLRTP